METSPYRALSCGTARSRKDSAAAKWIFVLHAFAFGQLGGLVVHPKLPLSHVVAWGWSMLGALFCIEGTWGRWSCVSSPTREHGHTLSKLLTRRLPQGCLICPVLPCRVETNLLPTAPQNVAAFLCLYVARPHALCFGRLVAWRWLLRGFQDGSDIHSSIRRTWSQ